jgi:hypothetical protein
MLTVRESGLDKFLLRLVQPIRGSWVSNVLQS